MKALLKNRLRMISGNIFVINRNTTTTFVYNHLWIVHKCLSDDKLVNFCFCTKTVFSQNPSLFCYWFQHTFIHSQHPSLTREQCLCALAVSRESYHRPVCQPQAAPSSPVSPHHRDILSEAHPQFRVQN